MLEDPIFGDEGDRSILETMGCCGVDFGGLLEEGLLQTGAMA